MNNSVIIENAMRAYDIALKALNERKAQVDQEIADITKERDRLQRQKYKLSSGTGGSGKKMRRGESLGVIEGYLQEHGDGASQSDISRETGVSISTCGRVLKKHEDRFVQDKNDLWRLQEDNDPGETDEWIK